MSSLSDSERCIPTINPGLSIPELIKFVKHSFRECEFSEVQNLLMDREKKMKMEIEDLKRDLDSIKKESRLLERSQSLAEWEKLRLEEQLQRSRRKCEELNETITRLSEEQRVSCDRAKRAEERYEKVCHENSKMTNEKNKLIFELNEKINKLKNKNLENERLVGEYQDKLMCLDTRVVEMDQEIEDLRREKLADSQTVEELRRKQFEADQVVEELKRQNFEATQKKMESDKATEFYKRNLTPRVTKMEVELAKMLKVKVEDLGNLVDTIEKSAAAAAKGKNVDLPDKFEGGKDSSGNGSANADNEDVAFMSSGVCYTSNSTGSAGIALSRKGGKNFHSLKKEDGANVLRLSPGSQSGCNPFRVESNDAARDNEGEESQVSGSRASVVQSDGGAQRSSKTARSSLAARDVIVICDSDDETNSGDTTSGQMNKRNRRECKRGFSPEFDCKEEDKHFQKRRG